MLCWDGKTRPHDDPDVIVPIEDVPELERALASFGFASVHSAPPLSFELADAKDIRSTSTP